LAKCTAITRGGERCRGVAIDSSGLCYAHHPDHAESRRRAARKGGHRGGRGRPVVIASEVAEQVQDLSDRVLAGELSRSDAAVCGQLLNVKLRALEVGRKLREAEDLEQRLDELEALIAARRESPWGA
jgi:hypothetical protein